MLILLPTAKGMESSLRNGKFRGGGGRLLAKVQKEVFYSDGSSFVLSPVKEPCGIQKGKNTILSTLFLGVTASS